MRDDYGSSNSGFHSDLFEDFFHVLCDCPGAAIENDGNFSIGFPASHPVTDFRLSVGQSISGQWLGSCG